MNSVYDRIASKATEVRIAVSGITGNGKSSLLNTMFCFISGSSQKRFKEGDLANSQTTSPETQSIQVPNKNLVVKATDNPGFLDSKGQEHDQQQLRQVVINNSNTTFHVILHCIPIDKKFDLSEQVVLDSLRIVYGNQVHNYLIICLTKADHINIQQRVIKIEEWRGFISKYMETNVAVVCTTSHDPSTVVPLFETIANIVEQRPGAFSPPAPPQVTQQYVVYGCCLDPNNQVKTKDGQIKLLREVQVGDLVESFHNHKVVYSPVYYVDLVIGEESPMYEVIVQNSTKNSTMQEQSVRMTFDHMIFRKQGRNRMEPIVVQNLKKGDQVVALNGNTSEWVTVIDIRVFLSKERITLLTWDDKLFANGILCSCYEVCHKLQVLDNIPMKILFKLNPKVMSTEKYKNYIRFWDKMFDNTVSKIKHK